MNFNLAFWEKVCTKIKPVLGGHLIFFSLPFDTSCQRLRLLVENLLDICLRVEVVRAVVLLER